MADPGHGIGDAGPQRILGDLRDPVLAPFVAVAAIPAMILATAFATVAFAAGRVAAVIFLAVTIAGRRLTVQWIVGDIEQSAACPGCFPIDGRRRSEWWPKLRAGDIGLHAVAEASFGIRSFVACSMP